MIMTLFFVQTERDPTLQTFLLQQKNRGEEMEASKKENEIVRKISHHSEVAKEP